MTALAPTPVTDSTTGAEVSVPFSADDERELTKATTTGAVISYGTFALSKVVTFGVTIVIARVLMPSEMGIMSLALLVANYVDTLNEFGISAAVVWFTRDDEITRSTAFWVDMAFGLGATLLVIGLSGPLASFFHEPALGPVLRLMSVSFLLTSIGSVHNAVLVRRIDFKRQIGPEVSRALSKGLLTVVLLATGLGVWSLVWGQLLGGLVASIWYISALGWWWPRLTFDRGVAKAMTRYGSTVAGVTFMAVVAKDVDYLIVGHRLGARALGLYTLGFRLPDLAIMGICYAMSNAVFPALSRMRDDPASLRRGVVRGLGTLWLITAPLGVLLVVFAHQLVAAFYGPRWAPTGRVLAFIAVYFVVTSGSFFFGDLYKATDRTGILNLIAVVRLPIAVVSLILVAPRGIVAVALCQMTLATVTFVAQLVVACRVTPLGGADLLGAFRPAAVVSAITAVVGIAGTLLLGAGAWPTLLIAGSVTGLVALAVGTVIGRRWWRAIDLDDIEVAP
jgi:PST family polysaccharide transporter